MECKIFVKASADVIHVPTDYPTIQKAINHANSGDTIFVHKGTYYEYIVINKSVSLVGEERDLTIVDGNKAGNVISIIKANNVSIRGFTIKRSGTNPYDCGIFVDHSSNLNISHNTIIDNYDGISFFLSSNNVISGNTIYSNDNDGISFFSSSNNVISGNTIYSNRYYGMYFAFYSSNNMIYFNNFNNTSQIWSDSKNIWDNDGGEGNYWNDYTGQDLNGDGIGDIPYPIDENNQDNHPLMGIFSDFEVFLERETYNVITICNSTISEFRFELGEETGNKIIRFNLTGRDGAVGFCRVKIPAELMNYPFIVIVDGEEINPAFLDAANETLYFTYILSNHTITIISSKVQHLYYELLDEHRKLQIDLYNLNATYYDLLNNYGLLLGNYSSLQSIYYELNTSYLEHLLDYSKNVQNVRNLMYVFASTTAIFIITTIYLSKSAHERKTRAPISPSES